MTTQGSEFLRLQAKNGGAGLAGRTTRMRASLAEAERAQRSANWFLGCMSTGPAGGQRCSAVVAGCKHAKVLDAFNKGLMGEGTVNGCVGRDCWNELSRAASAHPTGMCSMRI